MSTPLIKALRAQLDGPRDGAMLRFALGNALLDNGDATAAAQSARAAINFDKSYTAAWKLLGKALTAAGDQPAAIDAYLQGVEVAEQRGDVQAGKEMRVFLRRLERAMQ